MIRLNNVINSILLIKSKVVEPIRMKNGESSIRKKIDSIWMRNFGNKKLKMFWYTYRPYKHDFLFHHHI